MSKDKEQSVEEEDDLRAITRACAHSAQLLLQHGAESAQAEGTAKRIGTAKGASSVEVAILSNSLIVTAIRSGHCLTTVRRVLDRGINMHMLVEIQRIVLDTEKGQLSTDEIEKRLTALRPFHYNRWVVAAMVGLACAAFARLAHADLPACAWTFAASGLAMVFRQQMAAWQFNPLINFSATAFVATSISALALSHPLGTTSPHIAMASSVLMLVPGVPLINSLSDMVKGYVNTGISRLGFAALLCLGSCLGIALALYVWRVPGWL